MSTGTTKAEGVAASINVPPGDLRRRVGKAMLDGGASDASAVAATRAMMHASLHGIDSHGVRLAAHYCRMIADGRINAKPRLRVDMRATGSAMIDGDNGLGAYAAFRAIEVGCELAARSGIAGVGVEHSSHLGAAGAYALAAAEAGYLGFATTNSDSMVALHGGAAPFHGTNPLAFAAPVPGQKPWLLDMATSSIPMNRVLLHRALGQALPEGVAADTSGRPVMDPAEVAMLLPLGGAGYGFKGAGLAGVATLFSAILTGATLDSEMIPMYDPQNTHTPRNMGHFFIVIDIAAFVGRKNYDAAITRYLSAVRGSPTSPGGRVMAPGDREWREAERREQAGIPIDLETARFLGL